MLTSDPTSTDLVWTDSVLAFNTQTTLYRYHDQRSGTEKGMSQARYLRACVPINDSHAFGCFNWIDGKMENG